MKTPFNFIPGSAEANTNRMPQPDQCPKTSLNRTGHALSSNAEMFLSELARQCSRATGLLLQVEVDAAFRNMPQHFTEAGETRAMRELITEGILRFHRQGYVLCAIEQRARQEEADRLALVQARLQNGTGSNEGAKNIEDPLIGVLLVLAKQAGQGGRISASDFDAAVEVLCGSLSETRHNAIERDMVKAGYLSRKRAGYVLSQHAIMLLSPAAI